MDYAEGGSLRQWLIDNPDVKGRRQQALEYFRQACEGVKAIHKAGLVHLDLKPDNLLLQGEVIKVSDFGLSRGMGRSSVASPELLRDGVGTPWYMAPEQILAARPEDLECQADIYSLGVILFEILDGAAPYKGTAAQILEKIERGIRPKLRNVDGHPAEVVWRCLERRPEDRYQSVTELLLALVERDFSEEVRAIEQAIREGKLGRAGSLLKKAGAGGMPAEVVDRLLNEAKQKIRLRKEEKDRTELERVEAEKKRKVEEEERQRRAEVARKAEEDARRKAEAERKEREEEERRRAALLVCPVTGMEFVEVPGGSFDMGDVWGDGCDFENPVHRVTIRPFLMGKYPVTQAQWEKVLGNNPSHFRGADHPVDKVCWYDCQKFIKRLNEVSGRRYRLPSEAEWEYAARSGGQREKWAGTSDASQLGDYAWYIDNSGRTTHPVGEKKPNGLGLHDMSGNVWEWCQDTWHGNYEGVPADGSAWEGGGSSSRVRRGGSWFDSVREARAACRVSFEPRMWTYYYGFRLVLPLD
jgi:formylglycine-generating enzyme required for sulfatase activity